MMTTNIKKIYTILMALAFLVSCSSLPDHPVKADKLPRIFPDYIGVTVPVGIAPLDFNYTGGNYETMDVMVKGSKGGELHTNGN